MLILSTACNKLSLCQLCSKFCLKCFWEFPKLHELPLHCKTQSMKFIQNYHNEHTKIEFGMLIVVILYEFQFGMLIVVILYEFHTSHFAVYYAYRLLPIMRANCM